MNPEKQEGLDHRARQPRTESFDLVDFIVFLQRQVKTILIVWLTIILSAGIYLAATNPVYEAELRIGIGWRAPDRYIDQPSVIAARLQSKYNTRGATKLPFPRVRRVLSGPSDGFITVVVEGHSHNKAWEKADAVGQEIEADLEATQRILTNSLRQKIGSARKSLEILRNKPSINQGEGPRSASDLYASILSVEQTVEVENKFYILMDWEALLGELEAHKTKVTFINQADNSPAKPNKKLVLLLAAIGGLFAALASAATRELIIAARDRDT